MNILDNPELLDQLAAAMRWAPCAAARAAVSRRWRGSATVRASALIWQERFASMTELQAGDAPSPNVWKRIENLLAAQPQTRGAPVARRRIPCSTSFAGPWACGVALPSRARWPAWPPCWWA